MNTQKKPEDEIQFRTLLKNPIRLFGWIFPLFILLILIIGIYFVKHLNEVSYNVQKVGLVDSTLIKKEVELKKGGVMPAVDMNLVKSPTPEFISKGKELFTANCKSCHGDNGMGDGSAGAALAKKPRNFHVTDGWTNGRNIDQMFKTLQEGITKNGMAAYEYISAGDRFAIISFIRTFAQYPQITDEQLKSLDTTYKLSAGTIVTNKIPVSKAINKLIEESSAANLLMIKFVKLVGESQNNEGAGLIRKYSIDLKKVFTTFRNSETSSNFDKYVSSVNANPFNSGFQPTIVQLSNVEWEKVYDFLKTETM
jgi:hypothetical protein